MAEKVRPNEETAKQVAREIEPCLRLHGSSRWSIEEELYEHYPPWVSWDADDREWFLQIVQEHVRPV